MKILTVGFGNVQTQEPNIESVKRGQWSRPPLQFLGIDWAGRSRATFSFPRPGLLSLLQPTVCRIRHLQNQ